MNANVDADMKANSIDEILKRRRIIITCGTGGVGKTTVSAALAMRAAQLGKRAAVITIDPARRLATSLGLTELSETPVDLTRNLREAMPSHKIDGTFSALMPNAKANFDDFVKELSASKTIAEQIARNPLFQIFTKEFSGTNEYMALERLQALDLTGQFDCIILDTPPSRNALAFLNAPKLVAELFEERLIRWLVLPANRLLSAGMRKALGILEKLTGAGFMTNLLDFASTLFSVRVQFLANFEKTTRLLQSEAVGFIMVTTPTPEAAPDVHHFVRTLQEHRFHFEGLTINRTIGYLFKSTSKPNQATSPGLPVLEGIRKREEQAMRALSSGNIRICAMLPELARDIHSVEDLLYVAHAFETHHAQ